MNLDDRLRAAGRALQEGSATRSTPPAAAGDRPPAACRWRTRPCRPSEPAAHARQPAAPPDQRLALAVNLLLVLALGVALVLVAGRARRGLDPARPPSAPPARARPPRSRRPAPWSPGPWSGSPACLEAAELADEIISALNRNQRDSRLAWPSGTTRSRTRRARKRPRPRHEARPAAERVRAVGEAREDLLGDLGGELDRVAVGHHLDLGHAEGGVLAGAARKPSTSARAGRPARSSGCGRSRGPRRRSGSGARRACRRRRPGCSRTLQASA